MPCKSECPISKFKEKEREKFYSKFPHWINNSLSTEILRMEEHQKPKKMKRAKGYFCNEASLLYALLHSGFEGQTESIVIDYKGKEVYFCLKESKCWEFWKQLSPLIENIRKWNSTDRVDVFARKNNFRYINSASLQKSLCKALLFSPLNLFC